MQRARQRAIPDFRTPADDYLAVAPIAVVYGLDLLGVDAKHNFVNRSLRLLTAEALRLMNNKHWLSDVLVGAGIGVLSTNVAYLIFPEDGPTKERRSDLIITPSYHEGTVGVHQWLTLH